MKWKILSSEYLFSDLWFKVRKDICEAPGGKVINPYYVYEFPEWATAFALTEDNKVIMVRQYRHPVEEVIIELPGGCVDDADKDFQDEVRNAAITLRDAVIATRSGKMIEAGARLREPRPK